MVKFISRFTVFLKLIIVFGFIEFLWIFSISYNKQFIGFNIINNKLQFHLTSIIFLFAYYALYSFLIVFLTQYGINKSGLDFTFNLKFLFIRIFTLAIILRILINTTSILLEYFYSYQYVMRNTMQFALELLYIIVLLHNCFLIPLRKVRNLKISFKDIIRNIFSKKKYIFMIFLLAITCLIGIIALYNHYTNKFINYFFYNISKFTNADNDYLNNSLIFKQKFFMGLCLVLASCIIYLFFCFVYQNLYENKAKNKNETTKIRFSAKVIPSITFFLVWLVSPVFIFAVITRLLFAPLFPYYSESINTLGNDTFITIRDHRLPIDKNTVYNISITNVMHEYYHDTRSSIPLGEKRKPSKTQNLGWYFHEIPDNFNDNTYFNYDIDTSYFVDNNKTNRPYVGVNCYLRNNFV